MTDSSRPNRTIARNLPERYQNDIVEDNLRPRPKKKSSTQTMAAPLSRSSCHVGAVPQLRPASRPRGRPRTRHLDKPANNVAAVVESVEKDVFNATGMVYPPAAFPSLEYPHPAMAERRKSKVELKRDSMDARVSSSPEKPAKTSDHRDTKNVHISKHFFDGRFIDNDGNTLHGLAKYYDAHAQAYENEHRDSQGDSRQKNAAFRLFLETPEAQQAMQMGPSGAVTVAFERWWHGVGAKTTGSVSGEDEKRNAIAFKDEDFAKLHFKLQWCIIFEIEDDLARYPPRHTPFEAGGKSFRYARDILGIGSPLVARGIGKQVEEAKNQESSMPQEKDYKAAKEYLKGKRLPLTLIELYDYLDD